MIPKITAIEDQYQHFVQQVCATGTVYALKNAEGYATSYAQAQTDADGDPICLLCFWGDREQAASCIEDEWQDFTVVTITLSDFVERWCVGMSNQDMLAGIGFKYNIFGYETDPLELILDIITTLKQQQQSLALAQYEDMEILEQQVKTILGQ